MQDGTSKLANASTARPLFYAVREVGKNASRITNAEKRAQEALTEGELKNLRRAAECHREVPRALGGQQEKGSAHFRVQKKLLHCVRREKDPTDST